MVIRSNGMKVVPSFERFSEEPLIIGIQFCFSSPTLHSTLQVSAPNNNRKFIEMRLIVVLVVAVLRFHYRKYRI